MSLLSLQKRSDVRSRRREDHRRHEDRRRRREDRRPDHHRDLILQVKHGYINITNTYYSGHKRYRNERDTFPAL